MKKITSDEFVSNTVWKTVETVSTKVVSLVISTILARMISPDAYGIISLVTVFLSPFEGYCNCVNIALFCNKNADEKDMNSAMLLNFVIALVIYTALFLLAPLLANIYEKQEFAIILRALALVLFFQAVGNVIKTKASLELKTKEMAASSVISGLISGISGIVMAVNGYGIWALVVQTVSYAVIDMFICMYIAKWHFSLQVSAQKIKRLFSEGVQYGLSNAINTINVNICSIIGGRVYTSEDIGYNYKGSTYAEIVGLYAFGTINSFSLFTVTSRQDDLEAVKAAVKKILKYSTYIIFPIMFGLLAIADSLIPIWLSDVWIPSIPYFKLACITYIIYPISAICGTVLRGLGKHTTCTKLSFLSMVVSVASSIIFTLWLRLSLLTVNIIGRIVSIVFLLVYLYLFKKYINYSIKEIFKDILPIMVMNALMLVATEAIELLSLSMWATMILQVLVGGLVYLVLSIITKNECFQYLFKLASDIFKKRVLHRG